MTTAHAPAAIALPAEGGRWQWLANRWTILFGVALLFRLVFNTFHELAPDEAYYWVWTRHLSLSYFDHPPMVAYLIALSTRLFGDTEFAVRLPAALLSSGTAVLATAVVWRLTQHRAITWTTALLLVTSPVITVSGTINTPDTPLLFFSTLALWAGLQVLQSERPVWGAWMLFGAACGLSGLSKYTGIFVPAGMGLVLLLSPSRRMLLRQPACGAAVLLAIVLASPVIVWNAEHDWASFRFQFGHGMGIVKAPGVLGFVGFLGILLLTWTPVFGVLAIGAMAWLVRRMRQADRPTPQLAFIFLAAAMPLLLFAYSSFRKRVEGNWPAVAFVPAVVLVAAWAAGDAEKRLGALRVAWKISLYFAIVAHLPEAALLAGWKLPAARDVHGWRQLAMQVDRDAAGAPVVTSGYQMAAELTFYMPGHPDVWSVKDGRRANAYDYFAGAPDLTQLPEAVFVDMDPKFAKRYFPVIQGSEFTSTFVGRPLRTRGIIVARR